MGRLLLQPDVLRLQSYSTPVEPKGFQGGRRGGLHAVAVHPQGPGGSAAGRLHRVLATVHVVLHGLLPNAGYREQEVTRPLS